MNYINKFFDWLKDALPNNQKLVLKILVNCVLIQLVCWSVAYITKQLN